MVDIHNDNDDVVSRFRIQGSYDAETYGAKVGIGTDFGGYTGGVATEKIVEIYNAYAWYNFLNGVINVKGGLIDDGVWNTMGPKDWNLSNGLGVRLEVAPIEGLNFGVFLNTGANQFNAVTAEQFFKETGIGVSYTSDMFDIAAAFKLDSDEDTAAQSDLPDESKVNNVSTLGGDPDVDSEVIFGFVFKGVTNLTAKAEAHGWNLGDYSDNGFLWFIEDVSYQVLEPLNVGAELTERLWGNSNIKPFFQVKPYVSYQINEPLSVGLEVPVSFQSDVLKLGIGGKPWVKYAFTEDAYIKAFYNLDYKKPDAGDATTNHAIQLDFVVKF
ncbi:MAG: hypothetical protein LBK77_09075 [Spirochaetaceae bacterium]|jgi:hypothetical protein|nr:hypothetical protein [Spirochaetaceae bacterium]